MTTVRIWFTKANEASYISLLDLQRVMGRSIKRSGIPVWFTKGFNPHIYMSFSCPLPLGQESLCESVDVKTEQEQPDFEAWRIALNSVMPTGIDVFKVAIPVHKPEEIEKAVYKIRYPKGMLKQAAESYNSAGIISVMKKSKKGMKEIDLKQYIPSVTVSEDLTDSDFDRIQLELPAGVSFTVNPQLLVDCFENLYGVKKSYGEILRTGLLTKDGKNFE